MKQKLNSYISITDEALKEYLSYCPSHEKIIYEAMEYSVFAGGKRLRPVLCLSVCEMLGADIKNALPFACALEMIHTYSLIHDDLPALDNDDLRRGRPTSHKQFGEAMAILAGDALLNKAFETMACAVAKNPAKNNAEALSLIAECAGTKGMIGGQVVDILNDGKSFDDELLTYIHERKTGALIRASVLSGALIAGASKEEYEALDKVASSLGLAFQIQDDVLDASGDAKVMGKNAHNDSDNNKTNFVTLYGLDGAKELVGTHTQKAIDTLGCIKKDTTFLKELALMLVDRNK